MVAFPDSLPGAEFDGGLELNIRTTEMDNGAVRVRSAGPARRRYRARMICDDTQFQTLQAVLIEARGQWLAWRTAVPFMRGNKVHTVKVVGGTREAVLGVRNGSLLIAVEFDVLFSATGAPAYAAPSGAPSPSPGSIQD